MSSSLLHDHVFFSLTRTWLPPELYAIWEAYPWRLGEIFCYLRQSMLESSSYASVLTITAFTVERYLAICHPLLAHKISALSRAVKIIISIWVVSLLVALPYSIHTRIYNAVIIQKSQLAVPDSLICSIPSSDLNGFMYYMFQVSTFLFFVGPVTIISILYILIGIALRRSPLGRCSPDNKGSGMKNGPSSSSSSSSPHHHKQQQQPRRVVIRMLVAVTVAFIACWAPFHAQRLMVLYVVHWTPQLHIIQSHIFYISGVLYFVSSTVNPILYNVISKRYRAAFRQTIFPCCHTRMARGSTSTARPSDHFSRTQALVVLKNSSDSMRFVFRKHANDDALRDYETIPLNSTRRSTMMDDDDIVSIHPATASSASSCGSVHLMVKSSTIRNSYSAEYLHKEASSSVPCFQGSPCYFDNTTSADREHFCYVLHNKMAAEVINKAQKPRNCYACDINGHVSMKTEPAVGVYDSTKSSIVR
ncbi:unnamed protein product [Candidula unifasciata]|uniref:G-protein coupled receptors family 1 profile domain-containing protein n=1 Tax=Candidula unifasciata TaxID=100452 RepID=A0A8S3ZJ15_9EUPU|nr:unnamed protein product [Candidula unifasciata]